MNLGSFPINPLLLIVALDSRQRDLVLFLFPMLITCLWLPRIKRMVRMKKIHYGLFMLFLESSCLERPGGEKKLYSDHSDLTSWVWHVGKWHVQFQVMNVPPGLIPRGVIQRWRHIHRYCHCPGIWNKEDKKWKGF